MKLVNLIIELKELHEKHGNIDVVIDHDENGYHNVEKVKKITDDGNEFINIKSSNES
jgi:hypothetical protein